jgi:hypothetical protein
MLAEIVTISLGKQEQKCYTIIIVKRIMGQHYLQIIESQSCKI